MDIYFGNVNDDTENLIDDLKEYKITTEQNLRQFMKKIPEYIKYFLK